MTTTEHTDAYIMDLTALLKALREAQQSTTQVVQQLQETQQATAQVGHQLQGRLQAFQSLDIQTATALTQAIKRATATLKQEQEQTLTQMAGETQRLHTTLAQQWQQVIERATHLQRWLPWKVAVLLLGTTLLVHAGVAAWGGHQQAAERQALQGYQRLALGLDRHLLATLYPQLTKAQQRALDAVYTEAQFTPLSTRQR